MPTSCRSGHAWKDDVCATRKLASAHLEALWKQEGAKCCQFLRNPADGACGAGTFNWRECRKNTQPSAIVHGSFGTAHNLKVVGSNPTPATKINIIETTTYPPSSGDACSSGLKYCRVCCRVLAALDRYFELVLSINARKILVGGSKWLLTQPAALTNQYPPSHE